MRTLITSVSLVEEVGTLTTLVNVDVHVHKSPVMSPLLTVTSPVMSPLLTVTKAYVAGLAIVAYSP